MAKRIFIAATMQHDGKTTVSLGLIAALKKRFDNIGFIKPVGQRYLIEQGYKIDEDSVLIEGIYGIKCHIKDMSPIAIAKGFTESYIEQGTKEDYSGMIRESFDRVAKDNDLVVIEGTGHAGVGSVIDLCNARVAKLLNANVILISSGGIGKPIDEISLNRALFEKEGVRLAGVIVNKVLPEKYDKVNKIVRLGLKKKGLSVLGVLPFQKVLATPTVREIEEELKIELLQGKENLNTLVDQTLVCAMRVREALKYIRGQTLVITPGDREDIIRVSIKTHMDKRSNKKISGIILSGGIYPSRRTAVLMKKSNIPVLITGEDTYTIASRVHTLKVKLKPQDEIKVKVIVDMVERHVDIDKVLRNLT